MVHSLSPTDGLVTLSGFWGKVLNLHSYCLYLLPLACQGVSVPESLNFGRSLMVPGHPVSSFLETGLVFTLEVVEGVWGPSKLALRELGCLVLGICGCP